VANWPLLAFWGVRGGTNFGDLNLVLRNADCYKVIGLDIYLHDPSNMCMNYAYGRWLIRLLNFLHLGASSSIVLGILAIFCVSFILAHLLSSIYTQSKTTYVAGLAIAFSPPVMLLLERGNFDWLMFVLLYGGAFFLSRGNFKIAIGLLAVSILCKFYTFPILFFIMVLSRKKSRSFTVLGVCSLLFLQLALDLKLINSIFIETWYAAFGNTVWAEYLFKLGLVLNPIMAVLAGLLVCLIIYCVLMWNKKFDFDFIKTFRISNNFLVIFCWFCLFTFIGCYVAGMNYDYRLIFLLPAFILISLQLSKRISRYLTVVFVLIFWLSFNAKYLQPLGDILINIVFMIFFLALLNITKDNFRKVF
jgi:hypothetical protein